jgi:ATP-dependent protease ClpP protease subunit
MSCRHCCQGQASDILIQAREIERLRDMLVGLYSTHTRQDKETIGGRSEREGGGRECVWGRKGWCHGNVV